jgi:hypothetical protein
MPMLVSFRCIFFQVLCKPWSKEGGVIVFPFLKAVLCKC